MTRKQALELAGNEEAVQVLHTMIDELPLNRWTEAAIRDSVEQFILDNGRPPMRTDFKKKCLPPHSVVKRRFGVTLQEWLEQNYPTEKTPLDELHAQATQDFIREYLSMKTPVNLKHLEARLRQSGFLETEAPLDIDQLKDMLRARFATIDYDQARQDVLPFIKDPNNLAVWSQDFFDQITGKLVGV